MAWSKETARRYARITRRFLLTLSDDALEHLIADLKMTRLQRDAYQAAIIEAFKQEPILTKLITGKTPVLVSGRGIRIPYQQGVE